MVEQNYKNHRRYLAGYHILLTGLITIGLIVSIINFFRHPANSGGHVSSGLIVVLFICGGFTFWYMRQFPLKAQDRAIRAEESLRFFILTGKPLDSKLSPGQIAALRFASNEEFVALSARSISENLSPDDIKKSVKNWRADYHRV